MEVIIRGETEVKKIQTFLDSDTVKVLSSENSQT